MNELLAQVSWGQICWAIIGIVWAAHSLVLIIFPKYFDAEERFLNKYVRATAAHKHHSDYLGSAIWASRGVIAGTFLIIIGFGLDVDSLPSLHLLWLMLVVVSVLFSIAWFRNPNR